MKARSARRKKWICFWIVGMSIYAVSALALRVGWLMLTSTHCHYHWGRCWGWCWSDSWRHQKGYWDLIAMSPGCTHPPTTSHSISIFSFLQPSSAWEPPSDSCAGPSSSKAALQTATRMSFGWLFYSSSSFAFTSKKLRALSFDTSLRKICRIGKRGNRMGQQTASNLHASFFIPSRASMILYFSAQNPDLQNYWTLNPSRKRPTPIGALSDYLALCHPIRSR